MNTQPTALVTLAADQATAIVPTDAPNFDAVRNYIVNVIDNDIVAALEAADSPQLTVPGINDRGGFLFEAHLQQSNADTTVAPQRIGIMISLATAPTDIHNRDIATTAPHDAGTVDVDARDLDTGTTHATARDLNTKELSDYLRALYNNEPAAITRSHTPPQLANP